MANWQLYGSGSCLYVVNGMIKASDKCCTGIRSWLKTESLHSSYPALTQTAEAREK